MMHHLSFSFGLCIIRPFLLAFASSVLFFWLLYHLSFSFGLCIICLFLLAFVSSVLFFWPLYHLSFSIDLCTIHPFLLTFVSSGPFFGLCIIKRTDDAKDKRKGRMIQRPKEKDR
jgi:hypothetical protein